VITMPNNGTKKTILVVNSDVAVLVLMRGILQKDYRVLLAADAESASRLLTIDGLRIDLAVIDCSVAGSRRGRLQRQMTEMLPQLRIVPMAGLVQDGVIRLQAPTASNKRTSGSLVQRIRIALAADESRRTIMTALSTPEQISHEVRCIATKVMVAGHAIN
jgi:hypothetical protein